MSAPIQNVKPHPVEASSKFEGGVLDLQLKGYRPISLNRQLRQHYRERKKKLDQVRLVLSAALAGKDVPAFAGPVRLTYWQFYARLPMDWDNFGASMKGLLDGLVSLGVLTNDSPKEVAQVIMSQTKVSTEAEQGVRLILEPVQVGGSRVLAG